MKNRIFGVNKQKKPMTLNANNCSIKIVNTFLKNTKTKISKLIKLGGYRLEISKYYLGIFLHFASCHFLCTISGISYLYYLHCCL